MRKLFLGFSFILALSIGLLVWANATGQHAPKPKSLPANQSVPRSTSAKTTPTRAELLALVNAERAKNGVAALTEDPRLDQSAQMKADDLAQYSYFSHISPSTSPYAGLHGYQLIDKVGISCATDAENLVEPVPFTSSRAVTQWIESPEHHQAMIDSRYNLTGFGIVSGAVTEHFCQSR